MDNFTTEILIPYGLRVIGAILILIVGFWLAGKLSRLALRIMEKKEWDLSVRKLLADGINLVLKLLVILTVLQQFGFNILSFVAVFSAMALAIGLALQGHLANFASGVLILIFRYYKVGDFIQANGDSGTVKDIHIFHTVLEAVDNRLIIVPNGQITSKSIHNYTAQGKRRHDLTVGISYSADIGRAKELIVEVIQGLPNVDLEAGHDVFVKALNSSSVDLTVRFVAANEFFWPAYKLFFERLKKEFDEHGIGIPFPQMDVHLHKQD